jgi:hypothetical protein
MPQRSVGITAPSREIIRVMGFFHDQPESTPSFSRIDGDLAGRAIIA